MASTPESAAMPPFLKLALELGPLVAFFVLFNQFQHLGDVDALIYATVGFIAALLLSLAVTYAMTREVSRMAMVTTVVVLVTGGLTVWLRDDVFIKMKPTLINGLFALVLGFGLWRGRSYLKLLIGELLPITDEGWLKLTRNWALFFAAMAVLNEIVWRSFSTETWVDVKTFGYLPITLAFTLSQGGLIAKHSVEEDAEA